MSWKIVHLDLSGEAPEITREDGPVFAVFWWGELPLGTRRFAAEALPAGRDRLLPLATRFLAEQISARHPELGSLPTAGPDGRPLLVPPHLPEVADLQVCDELIAPVAAPSRLPADRLSVVVCTRDRPADLEVCLSAITRQRQLPGEIVVVDNSSDGTAAAICARFPGVRHVHEPRPGLSRARNAGIAACTLDLIAFTDDDVEVHPGWAGELVRAFADSPAVEAVTGLVLPAELDTPAQRFFQFELGGFGSGCLPVRYDRHFLDAAARQGPQVWRIGAGANMAFRRSVFQRVGLFDERLGAGAAGCSEDSELWYRILAAGGSCLYEPRAVVHHHHRADWAGLESQTRAYMRGHVAALVAQHQLYGHTGNIRRVTLQLPRYFLRMAGRRLHYGGEEQGRMLRHQVRGWMSGLVVPLTSEWRRGAVEPIRRAPLSRFLAANPFPNPLTGGLFYREKMRAIHRVSPERLSGTSVRPRILEIGGGRSGLASLLYPGASITNVDLDFTLLGEGPGADRYRYVCGDACRLPFADDSFDVVTLFDVLEHIPDDAAAAAEALRVTRPGGWVLVSTPHAAWRYPYFEFMRRWCPPEDELTKEWGHVRRGYTEEDLTTLFGMGPRRSATFVNAVTAFYHDVGFSRLGPRKRRLLYALTAAPTIAGYLLHRRDTAGTETALAWQRE
jgi:GT2 family glycosyltransferase/SAM-dependent methyltransferase